MKQQKHLVNFINHITNNNFKQANGELAAIVNEKIKQRIRAADQALVSTKSK